MRELDAEFDADSGHSPTGLLQAIADYGGLSIRAETGLQGELRWLKEHSAETLTGKGAKFGRVGNVSGVFSDSGLSVDDMVSSLQQDAKFSHIRTLNDFLAQLQAAIQDAGERHDEPLIERFVRGLGERFHERIGTATPSPDDDISFDPAELEGDILDTGEVQPRLPEAGAVREQHVQTPEFEAPFSLTGGADTTPKERPRSLFEETPAKPSPPVRLKPDTTQVPEPAKPSAPVQMKGSTSSGGGREAMAGLFSEALPARSASRTDAVRPVQFPELVDLARELARTPSVVKAFRNPGTRGDFNASTLGGGQIRLHADLFKPGQEQQLAATLAHEIGHLVDWLPHQTLKRGNILGRLFSLRSFLKGTFIAPDGQSIKNKDVRRELTALSNKWRPWDPATASPGFAAYRKSDKEIFADALSVLLNNPGLLKSDAPIFHEQFFTALDQKPEVKRAYEGLQELLAGTPEELTAKRRAGVQAMFKQGDVKAMALERQAQADRRQTAKNLWMKFRMQMVDKNVPIIDRVKALEKRGIRINQDDDPRYFLEERNYLGGKLKAFTEQHFQPIHEALAAHDVDWHTFGEMLFYERIAAGDRSEIANPRGISPAVATELAADLMRRLNPEQRTLMRQSLDKFRGAVKSVADQAHGAGLYSDALHAQIAENPAYAAFRVIDHLERDVTSRVYQQIGTLKDITNPADASILKTLVTIKAVEQQRMKVAVFDFLAQHYPTDILQAKEVGSPKGRRPIESPDKDQHLITYYEQGRLRGKYVDGYIADSLTNASVGQNWAVMTGMRFVNSYLFRPVFTMFNPGFMTFNAVRDFLRFWKNTPSMTIGRAMQRYRQAVPMARVRAFGLPQAPTFAQRQGQKDVQQAEEAKILSVTLNDLNAGRDVEETQIADTFAKLQVGGFGKPPRAGLFRHVGMFLDWMQQVGDYIETLPKAAAMHEFKGEGTIAEIGPETRSFIRRKVGSPDFLAGGTFKPITNEVVLFSNAIIQGIRADLEVATGPKTRAGFWWKTVAKTIVPKLAWFAVLFGLAALKDDDDDPDTPWLTRRWHGIRRAMRGVSEYDLTNYSPVPLGLDDKGNAIYLRLPEDDSGRLLGGLTWKLLRSAGGDRDALKSAMQVLDYTAGQAPSLSPILRAAGDVTDFAAGRNVYDSFRSRFLFTDDELKARNAGTVKKFLGFEFQQLGGSIVWKFYPGEERPRDRSTAQKILDLPILSNVVGRWIKVSNFGEVERLRETQGQVQQQEARTRQAERAAVNDALRQLQDLPAAARTPAKQQELAWKVVFEVHADKPPPARFEEYKDVLKKIRMGVVRGHADALTDTVMSATSNAQKVAIILKAGEDMSAAEFTAWLQRASQEQVVSANVRVDVLRRRARP